MSDVIGRVTVPDVVASGTTFPLVSEFGYGFSQSHPIVTHRFGSLDAKVEQRYKVGLGPRKFVFKRSNLSISNRTALAAFWEVLQGPYKSFTYNAPNADQTFSNVTVTWEQAPLSLDYLIHACRVGITFVELPSTNPSYTVSHTCLRFPSTALATALLDQVQEIIPLVHIRPREAAVSDIYLSDRRCIVGGQQYLPRVLGLGEPGSDTILTQDIKGSADNVRFAFGNADSVMTELANDTDLKYASIDLCLYHVNSQTVIQLWKGYIQTFSVDGSPNFIVQASDGLFQINQQYPVRTISRTCWKTYNDGLNCPWATEGSSSAAVIAAGGDPASCDYYYDSVNGCKVHGMNRFFGGIPLLPQSAKVKDNSTGFLGFGRNTVTATSIVSDTIWGKALADIYCNQGSTALNAFIVNALIAAVRDNGDFFDVLGILGSGPLQHFTIEGNFSGEFVTNANGFATLVAPLADGLPAQGFKIASSGTSASTNNALGLRQVKGNDPVPPAVSYDQFGLANIVGQNPSPLPFAAGVSFCELLYPKPSGITPSIADTHSMTVPIAQGLSGWTWELGGGVYLLGGLVGAFTDSVGEIVGPLVWFGNGPTVVTSPIGAVQLQLGINDDKFVDNIGSFVISVNAVNHTILGTAMPWSHAGGINASYPYGLDDGTGAVVIAAPTGTVLTVTYVSGTVKAGGSFSPADANGLAGHVADTTGSTGTFFPAYYLAGRILAGGLINPFWIALNTFLRAIGQFAASSSDQLNLFVLSSLMAGDGTGAAEIAAAFVPAVLGGGYETQFQFQGSIDTQKPLRDWLVEILNVGLGYFTWEFGKIKFGCRINASAVDAYTLGNIKFQTLQLSPITAAFEKLIIDFADAAYQFQANTAEYQDKDHAAYYGRAGSPLTSRMHSVGASTLSQALRLAATRTREEIGGVNAAEWRNARDAAWETTLLGLNNEVGQVVSITDPVKIPGLRGTCDVDGSGNVTPVSGDAFDDSMLNKDVLIAGVQYAITSVTGSPVTSFACTPTVPTASGVSFKVVTMDFRIQSWSLRKDWSIAIAARTVSPSMYDLLVGPTPTDVLPSPLPILFFPIPDYAVWCPYQVQYSASDPLFPSEWTFDLQELQPVSASGVALTSLVVTGCLPVDQTSIEQPSVGVISVTTTGGTLPGGQLIKLSLCALDANGLPSTPIDIAVVSVPAGTNTNLITLSSIVWPAVTGLTEYVIFASTLDDLICAQVTGALTPTGGGTTYTPASVAISAPLQRATWALPNPNSTKLSFKVKTEVHGGVIGALVDSVSAGHITCGEMTDTSGGGFTPVGRVVSVIGRGPTSTVPMFNALITSWTPSTGTIGCTPDPNGIVQGGDVILVRFLGYDNSAAPTTFTDAGALNETNLYSGFAIDAEKGNILRVISGLSRGHLRKITSNTATALNWDEPLVLDATSVVIVESPEWIPVGEVTQITNANPTSSTQITLPVSNLLDEVVIVSGFVSNSVGTESEDGDQPIREAWLYGTQATRVITASTTVLPTDGTIQVDTTAGPVTVAFPSADTMLNQTVIVQKTSSDANAVTVTGPSGGYTLGSQWAYVIVRGSV